MVIRPIRSDDAAAARSLLAGVLTGIAYAEAARDALDGALGGASDELHALVGESNGELTGLVVYGPVAGTVATARVHVVAVRGSERRRGVASRLCEAAVRKLHGQGARLIVVEMAEVPETLPARALLARCGWSEEARVADFFADGVHLLLFRRELGSSIGHAG